MGTTRSYLYADDRRETLLDAFGRLLERKSPDSITMVEVADEAGVSRALLYRHFSDLGSLIQAYFDHRAMMFFERMDPSGGPLERTPAGALVGLGAIVEMPPGELRAIEVLLTNRLHPDLIATRDRFHALLLERWATVIDAAPDRQLAAHVVWTMVRPFVALAMSVQQHEMTLAEADGIWRAMLAGVAALLLPVSPTDPTRSP